MQQETGQLIKLRQHARKQKNEKKIHEDSITRSTKPILPLSNFTVYTHQV